MCKTYRLVGTAELTEGNSGVKLDDELAGKPARAPHRASTAWRPDTAGRLRDGGR